MPCHELDVHEHRFQIGEMSRHSGCAADGYASCQYAGNVGHVPLINNL